MLPFLDRQTQNTLSEKQTPDSFFCNFYFQVWGILLQHIFWTSEKKITGGVRDRCKTEADRVRGIGSIFNFNWNLNIFIETVRVCWHSSIILQLFHTVEVRKCFIELCFSPLVFFASAQNVKKKFALWFTVNKFSSASRYYCSISQFKYLFLKVYF